MLAMKLALIGLALQVAGDDLPKFSFGGVNAQDEMKLDNPVLAKCVGTEINGSCSLAIPSFADIRILSSIVAIKQGRLHELFVNGTSADYAQAIEALKAKYGKPSESYVNPVNGDVGQGMNRSSTWRFADGFLICQVRDGEPQFILAFASNRKLKPKIDF